MTLQTGPNDALLIVDVQNDFLPGGALGVPGGDEIIPVLNAMIDRFHYLGQPVIASRDWHPPHNCSFTEQGGIWPPAPVSPRLCNCPPAPTSFQKRRRQTGTPIPPSTAPACMNICRKQPATTFSSAGSPPITAC